MTRLVLGHFFHLKRRKVSSIARVLARLAEELQSLQISPSSHELEVGLHHARVLTSHLGVQVGTFDEGIETADARAAPDLVVSFAAFVSAVCPAGGLAQVPPKHHRHFRLGVTFGTRYLLWVFQAIDVEVL